jgi:hypothetical protein
MGSYDAVPVPSVGPSDALRLIRARFPELSKQFGDPDNIDPETPEPYYSYGLLVKEVLKREDEAPLIQRVIDFINELALSRESLLEDLVGVELLEGLAQDRKMAATLYPRIVPAAQKTLKLIEQETYGRTN